MDEFADTFSNELDRLERVLAGKEAELQRLRTELALKTLYVEELQTTLDAQARELEAFDVRLRHMEGRISKTIPPETPAQPPHSAAAAREPGKAGKPVAGKPVPLLIRIRRGMRE